jgi:hypothetical protein
MITRWDEICCLCLPIIASSSHHTTPNLFNKCLPNPKSAVAATAAPSPCPYRSPPFLPPPSSVTVSTAAPHAVLCMFPHFPLLLRATIDGKNHLRFSVNLRIMEKDVAVEKGQTKTYADKGTSGKDVTRHFCGDCGSYVAFSYLDDAILLCCTYRLTAANKARSFRSWRWTLERRMLKVDCSGKWGLICPAQECRSGTRIMRDGRGSWWMESR